MSGVLETMRRRLLSCTMIVHGGLVALALVSPAKAADDSITGTALAILDSLHSPELAAGLTISAAILGFSVVSAILLMRTRINAAAVEGKLRTDNQSLQNEADRLRALLFTEPQVLISWDAGDDHPDISGDVALLIPNGSPSSAHQRILAFGTWLGPEHALQMDHAVEALRERGEGFLLSMATLNGHMVEAMGRAVGGQAIIRIRELSGVRRELAEVTDQYHRIVDETDALRAFAANTPLPLWSRRANGSLRFVNAAYAQAAEARDAADAVERGVEFLDSEDRAAMTRALAVGQPFKSRVPVAIGGERRTFDVYAMNVTDGSIGVAIDSSEATALHETLMRMTEAHRRMLDQLSSGVAVFDAHKRLTFFNDSYRRLWDLDRAFLDSGPDDNGVLEKLRASRKISEQPDWRAWKNKLHEAYRAIEPEKDTWYLPDGRAMSIVTTPNPEGGVTYLFDDVTESLKLQRQNDGLLRVQRETLDNLSEAVAVFGGNGRAKLFNPPFARLWKLSTDELLQQPHIETVQRWCQPLFDEPTAWQTIHAAVTGIDNRDVQQLRMERKDGSVLDCMTIPLPDGATMLTFEDVTDSVNVERALRERNDALEAADQMKVDFLHHVSYELRSPLTTIIGFAHFLSDPATGPMTVKQSEYLSYITTSTNALLAIINNILDLATIDAGAMTLDLGPVNLQKAVEEATAGLQDRFVHDNVSLTVDIAPAAAHFVADERRIVQILYNLLANAVGFSPTNSTIRVTARRSRDLISFSVADAGPGVPDEMRTKMFDWFESRANGSRHRGAGLGLSLVRSFVELHGGTVRVDSVVGEGTTVTCEFPADRTAHRHAAE
ncbi:MAG: PAS-domain containing protein [Xanthobacteraceae bacterium]|nr:PAS-domain containing protein [Xanthobacteraceae bacterium]